MHAQQLQFLRPFPEDRRGGFEPAGAILHDREATVVDENGLLVFGDAVAPDRHEPNGSGPSAGHPRCRISTCPGRRDIVGQKT
jgi:hypothetical protein